MVIVMPNNSTLRHYFNFCIVTLMSYESILDTSDVMILRKRSRKWFAERRKMDAVADKFTEKETDEDHELFACNGDWSVNSQSVDWLPLFIFLNLVKSESGRIRIMGPGSCSEPRMILELTFFSRRTYQS